MNRQKHPIGIANFQSIRTRGYYYVDKTPHIKKLIDQGEYYFLSRPRRFGKSLLLDTMRELFAGNESLFEGLHIHGHWDWSTQYPVVRLSFGSAHYGEQGILKQNVRAQLKRLEIDHRLTDVYESENLNEFDRFGNLLYHIHAETGKQVVVLVDEYDKPILDALDNPELAKSNRDFLQGLYGVIKDFGEQIRFAFLTGITMFSKLNLFSALNNLDDISLDPQFSAICGYTEHDLETVFAPELEGLDRSQIRHWYNGYNWLGEEKVYNPWAILKLLKSRKFEMYWSVASMPTFLYKVMMERRFTPLDVDNLKVEKSFVSTFEIGSIGAKALMFQSGYLTIKKEYMEGVNNILKLDYPNLEVRAYLNEGYLGYLFGSSEALPVEPKQLVGLLEKEDFEGFEIALRTLFSAIPHQWHASNSKMACYEGWYCSVLYSCLWDVADTGIRAEESSSRGRSDLSLVIGDQVFVFECKMLKEGMDKEQAAAEAIEQINDRGYADRYRDGFKSVHLIGAVFDSEEKNLAAMKVV